jgi:hypothetical protein
VCERCKILKKGCYWGNLNRKGEPKKSRVDQAAKKSEGTKAAGKAKAAKAAKTSKAAKAATAASTKEGGEEVGEKRKRPARQAKIDAEERIAVDKSGTDSSGGEEENESDVEEIAPPKSKWL